MCGVVAGIVRRPGNTNRARVGTLLRESTHRGQDAWGLDTFTGAIRRGAIQHARQHQVGTFESIPQVPNVPFSFVGICRGEPTTEWHGNTSLERDIQPFTVGKWTIVHNGTIANDHDLKSELRQSSSEERLTEVDSWTIAYVFDRYGFERGLKMLQGSFAIVAVNADHPSTLYYACNYKPLWVLGDNAGHAYWIASQKSYLRYIAGDPLRDTSPVQIAPYTYGTIKSTGVTTTKSLHNYTLPLRSNTRTLVVCSGGLDSTVAAWKHYKNGENVTLLNFLYDARAQEMERDAITHLLNEMYPKRAEDNERHHVEIKTDFFSTHTSSPLTDTQYAIAQGELGAEYAHEWVPARNTVMIALAVAYAENNGFDRIVLGTNQEESCGGYPDNEQEFINKWNELLPFAVKPYTQMHIDDDLGGLMKHEIVTLGHSLGAPMEKSYSCYHGRKQHCGNCGPCLMRRRAFAMARVDDLTEYEIKEMQ
jgi:7-cyano-7-deazaguanine synthase